MRSAQCMPTYIGRALQLPKCVPTHIRRTILPAPTRYSIHEPYRVSFGCPHNTGCYNAPFCQGCNMYWLFNTWLATVSRIYCERNVCICQRDSPIKNAFTLVTPRCKFSSNSTPEGLNVIRRLARWSLSTSTYTAKRRNRRNMEEIWRTSFTPWKDLYPPVLTIRKCHSCPLLPTTSRIHKCWQLKRTVGVYVSHQCKEAVAICNPALRLDDAFCSQEQHKKNAVKPDDIIYSSV